MILCLSIVIALLGFWMLMILFPLVCLGIGILTFLTLVGWLLMDIVEKVDTNDPYC